ncbi:MAG TPA: hypothetical protein VJJ98_07540 [Sedimentisphaerales bacterium]|nr:hypothetical protein [Sedimentisphaerales bacterium]
MAEEHKESTQRIRVICESCGKIYRVSPQSIGKKAKCACGHSFLLRQVTEPESVVSTPEARLAAQPPRTAVNQRIMWFLLATLFASIALYWLCSIIAVGAVSHELSDSFSDYYVERADGVIGVSHRGQVRENEQIYYRLRDSLLPSTGKSLPDTDDFYLRQLPLLGSIFFWHLLLLLFFTKGVFAADRFCASISTG